MSQILPITTITDLQKRPRNIINDTKSFKVILSNNEEIGVIMNIKMFKQLVPDPFDLQIKEELWELADKTTQKAIKKGKQAMAKKDFSDFLSDVEVWDN